VGESISASGAMEPPVISCRNPPRLASLDAAEVAARLGTETRTGLANGEIGKRLEAHGANELTEGQRRSPWLMLAGQFTDFMIVVLLAAAVVAGVVGEPQDSIAIVVIRDPQRGDRLHPGIPRRAHHGGAAQARRAARPRHPDGKVADVPARELVPATSCFSRRATSCRRTCASSRRCA